MLIHAQVRLVLEFCDIGNMRDALDRGVFLMKGSRNDAPAGEREVNYSSVLDTAIDIATGMAHLHASNVIHADLKVRGGRGRGESEPMGGGGVGMRLQHPVHLE